MEINWKDIDENINEFPEYLLEPYKGIDLYEAWSYANNFGDSNNSKIFWYITNGRFENFDYDNALMYNDEYSREYINQLFTLEEILELKDYIFKKHNIELFYKKINFPITSRISGFGVLPLIKGENCYHLYKEIDYSLAFEVEAFYNVLKHTNDFELKKELELYFNITKENINVKFIKNLINENRIWLLSNINNLYDLNEDCKDKINSYFIMQKLIGG
jgi:hypothetical protein